MKAISLFAGIGAGDLACERTGIKVMATAEIDPHAHALLKRKWPTHHHYTDVKDVTRDGLLRDVGALPRLAIAGFPCQDLSIGGAGAGLDGARSGLFWEIIRIARECGVEWLLLENVPGLLSPKHRWDMGTILGALSDSGYGWAYRVLDAQHFGVPQRRRRLFFVARLGDDGRAPAEVLHLTEDGCGDPGPVGTSQPPPGRTAKDGPNPKVVGTLTCSTRHGADDGTAQAGHIVLSSYRKSRRAQSTEDYETWVEDDKTNTLNLFDVGDARTTSLNVLSNYDVRRLTPVEWERLQGLPDDWTADQSVSARCKQLGNTFAVPVVQSILERLLAVDARVGSPRHDAIVHELLEGVPQVGAEVAVPLLTGDLPGSSPEVVGDADVA